MSTADAKFKQGISDAFAASKNGTATPEQLAIKEAFTAALKDVMNDDSVIDVLSEATGSFASVYESAWEDLTPVQRWVRHNASQADRAVPALASMLDVYNALVAAGNSSGPGLRLGSGVNVIGLDKERRRWLIPGVSKQAVNSALNAEDEKSARMALRRHGSVAYHWSMERTLYIPDAHSISELLPLPEGGKYLLIYSGSPLIVTKDTFRKAFKDLAANVPVSDLLVWHTDGDGESTLWSTRGRMGHRTGTDIQSWQEDLIPFVNELATAF